jgi:hypothetical protein
MKRGLLKTKKATNFWLNAPSFYNLYVLGLLAKSFTAGSRYALAHGLTWRRMHDTLDS